MPVYIKNATGDILSFDAVMSIKEDYQSRVTEHPIESGGNVTDHVVKQNLKIGINGVFSDYSPTNNQNFSFSNNDEDFKSGSVKNSRDSTPLVTTTGNTNDASLIGYNYSVEPSVDRVNNIQEVKQLLINMQRQGEVVTIFEIEGTGLRKNSLHTNSVITSIGFSEDENSGEALYVNMTVSVVQFADSKSVDVSPDLLKPAATEQVQAEAPSPIVAALLSDKSVLQELKTALDGLAE